MPEGAWIVAFAAGFVVVLLAVVWVARYRRQRLGGTLTVFRDGHLIHEVALSGRQQELDASQVGFQARVRPLPRDAERRSRIVITSADKKSPVVLADGQGHEVGDVFVEYQDQHSRTVDRITPDHGPRPRRRTSDQP